jgi:hypothetical protein
MPVQLLNNNNSTSSLSARLFMRSYYCLAMHHSRMSLPVLTIPSDRMGPF